MIIYSIYLLRVSTESSYLIRTETAFPWVNANEQCVFPGCSHLPSFNANNTNNPDTALLQQSETFRVVHINQVLMRTIRYPGYKNITKTKNLQIIP